MIDSILEITFDASSAIEDEIAARLFLLASSGSSSREEGGRTIISAYFDSASARDAARAALNDLDVDAIAIDRPRVDWLDMYQQSLQPIAIGKRFIVAPDLGLIARDDPRLRIVVPQEQAFGTGSHETTALCIEMLEQLQLGGSRGLDVGSGSGILAMAMLRLGAAKVIAFDNDRDAFAALRDNRMRNQVVESAMPLFIGSVESLRGGTFDVITMNIIPEVIIPLLADVASHLAPRGTLILSGILTARRDDVLTAANERSLTLDKQYDRGEWWCASFRRITKPLAKPSQMY